MSELSKQDLYDLKRDLSELFDAKLQPLTQAIMRHEDDLRDHSAAISALSTGTAVSDSKLKSIAAGISVVVSAGVAALWKLLKL